MTIKLAYRDKKLSVAETAETLKISKETLRRWDQQGVLVPNRNLKNNYREYEPAQLELFEEAHISKHLNQTKDNHSNWDVEMQIKPNHDYKIIELFAGAGGLALGLEKAGFESLLLNELNKDACQTLRSNRPHWNIVEGDISKLDFTSYRGQVDVLSGGFPCQAFSYAGKKLGFEDTRGSLFFEFARAIKECRPNVVLAENVRGLLKHDEGKTLKVITDIIDELGYELVEPRVLKAMYYQVPQKRERLVLIGIRKDLLEKKNLTFKWPAPFHRAMTMTDALKKGVLFKCDVPISQGQKYPTRKKEIMKLIPKGGYWRDLPEDLQKEYMQKSYYLGGGKTGMARRLSWDEPSLTLTCAPAQKQTERCHPDETRPLTVREYARIQTFPDDWFFSGSQSSQYKQIGNAVPVNLSFAVGRALVCLLNNLKLK